MIQTPAVPDSVSIQIPLPTIVEGWRDLYLQSAVETMVVFIAFARSASWSTYGGVGAQSIRRAAAS